MDAVPAGVLWPFVVAPKPPQGYTTVAVPAFLAGVDMRAAVDTAGGEPTAEPLVRPATFGDEQVWLAYHVVRRDRTDLPPVGGGYASSSSRPIVTVQGCVVRAGDRPSAALVQAATSPAVMTACDTEFLRFWTSDDMPGTTRTLPPLEDYQPETPTRRAVEPTVPPLPSTTPVSRPETADRRPAVVVVVVVVVVVLAVVLLAISLNRDDNPLTRSTNTIGSTRPATTVSAATIGSPPSMTFEPQT